MQEGHLRELQSLEFVRTRNTRYIDEMFRKKWDYNFLKENIEFMSCMHLCMASGWTPDEPIRHLTGVTLLQCNVLRISFLAAHFVGAMMYYLKFLFQLLWFLFKHSLKYKMIYESPLYGFIKIGLYILLLTGEWTTFQEEIGVPNRNKFKVN